MTPTRKQIQDVIAKTEGSLRGEGNLYDWTHQEIILAALRAYDGAGAVEQLAHIWDKDGEHCTVCGDPDWCATESCSGGRCIATFELSRQDRDHIAEFMGNYNPIRVAAGLQTIDDISGFLAYKVMCDIRTQLQTMRSTAFLASRSNEDGSAVEPNQCDSGISRVYELCNRYESGYGHGIKRDGLDLSKTPHSDAELGEAYQIGYDAGSERYVEPPEVRSDDNAELIVELTKCKNNWPSQANSVIDRAIAALSAPSPVRSDEPVAWQWKWDLPDNIALTKGTSNPWQNGRAPKGVESVIERELFTHPAPSHVAPDGMVSVPIEPTDEMVKAGREVFGEHVEDTDADYKRIYKTMIAIAGKEVV